MNIDKVIKEGESLFVKMINKSIDGDIRDMNKVDSDRIVEDIFKKEMPEMLEFEQYLCYDEHLVYSRVLQTVKTFDDDNFIPTLIENLKLILENNLRIENEIAQKNLIKLLYKTMKSYRKEKLFLKNLKTLKEAVIMGSLYHEMSLILTCLVDFKVDNNGNSLIWSTFEMLADICFYTLLEDGVLKTGHFEHTNRFFQANELLKKYKSKCSNNNPPKWVDNKLNKRSYDPKKDTSLPQYISLYQNIFHFYDAIMYKHSLKMFDNLIGSQEKRGMFQSSIVNDFDFLKVTNEYFKEIEIETLNKIIKNRNQVFFQTAFRTFKDNKYLATELLTKRGRKLLVFGTHPVIDKFIVEINLSDLSVKNNFKSYSICYDWQVEEHHNILDKILMEIFFSYFYIVAGEKAYDFHLPDNMDEERFDLVDFYNQETKVIPEVLTYDKNEKVYGYFNVLKSEYREIAPFIRRLPEGWEMSDDAKRKANEMNYHIPEGYTFVESHTKRVRVKNEE